MDDILKKIKDKEGELDARYARMKDDLARYYLDSFELKNELGRAVKEARNVTLNDQRVFPDRVAAVLSSAEPRIEVYGNKLPKGYESKVEDLWDSIVYDCNRKLQAREMGELHPTLSLYSVISGWLIVRGWVWSGEGGAMFDILPCDPLNVAFDVGDDGLLWVANKRPRSAAAIERAYDKKPSGKSAIVTDYWDEEVNVVYVGKEKVKEEYSGRVPFVIHPVGSIPPLGRDETEAVKYHGDSIYSANRHMYDIRNEVATIANSLDYLMFRPPLGYESPDGTKLPEEYPFRAEAVTAMGPGEKWHEPPIGHIKEAALFLWSVVDPASQRGSLVYSEYGELGFQLSAIAIEKLEAHRDQVFVPRLKALTAVYRDLAHLLLDQFVELGLPAELGERGDKATYQPSEFTRDFSVKFGMSTTSPEKRVASYSIARAAEGLLSDDTKRRDILQIANPEEEEAKLRDDEILALVPTVRLSRHYDELGRRIKETSGEEKKSLERERKLIKLALIQAGAMAGPRKEEEFEATTPATGLGLMSADEKIERESMRRQGLEREVA